MDESKVVLLARESRAQIVIGTDDDDAHRPPEGPGKELGERLEAGSDFPVGLVIGDALGDGEDELGCRSTGGGQGEPCSDGGGEQRSDHAGVGFLARKTKRRCRHRASRMRADNRTTTRLSVRLRVTRSISHRRGAFERGLALSGSSEQRVALFHKSWSLYPPAAAAHKRHFRRSRDR